MERLRNLGTGRSLQSVGLDSPSHTDLLQRTQGEWMRQLRRLQSTRSRTEGFLGKLYGHQKQSENKITIDKKELREWNTLSLLYAT
jgi:hypothetical protein